MYPKLFNYGIFEEQSDIIRAHVSPATRRVYVFRTVEAQALLQASPAKYPKVDAMQPGVSYRTGRGYLVPPEDIPNLRVVDLHGEEWWDRFRFTFDTTKKGKYAVKVVVWMLKNGRFPLWIQNASESNCIRTQRGGTDIVLWAHKRIQVKCDWQAGPKELGGSGSLFLQTEEANPLGKY